MTHTELNFIKSGRPGRRLENLAIHKKKYYMPYFDMEHINRNWNFDSNDMKRRRR